MSQPRLLLISPPIPQADSPETAYLGDVMAHRFTRGQSVFTLRSRTPCPSIYYLAGRLNVPTRVLEAPSPRRLRAALRAKPEFVGLSSYPIQAGLVLEQCRLIRQASPRSRIVLGGLGCAWEGWGNYEGSLWDLRCRGEGLGFLRDLLQDRLPVRPHPLLPLSEIWLPGVPGSRLHWGLAVAGLGCPRRCDFCSTSAFYEGQRLSLLSARELIELNERYHQRYRKFDGLFVIEEDFLEGKRIPEMIDLYRTGKRDPGKAHYYCFAALDSLHRTDPDDLLRAGIAALFIGYESSTLKKHDGHSFESASEFLSALHHRGIGITLTFICGVPGHRTREDLELDIRGYLSLPATFNQVSILTPFPGTELAERKDCSTDFRDFHFYDPNHSPSSLSPTTLGRAVRTTQEMAYRLQGPSVLRILKALLHGIRYCRDHPDELIRARGRVYEQKALEIAPLLDSIAYEAARQGFDWDVSQVRRTCENLTGFPRLASTILRPIFQVSKREPRHPAPCEAVKADSAGVG